MNRRSIMAAYDTAESWSYNRTCNERQVGVVLLLNDGAYFGSSGSKSDSCIGRECRRDPENEYGTCPSLCAEGEAIDNALKDGKDLRDAILVGTDFPCDRCIDTIYKTGIRKVVFHLFKMGNPREKDIPRIKNLMNSGVEVYKISKNLQGKREIYLGVDMDKDRLNFPHRNWDVIDAMRETDKEKSNSIIWIPDFEGFE